MKKIKSSLELAMERLGKVEGSREELKKLDEEKYLKAAAALGNSFLEGKISKEQVGESIQRYPEEMREQARHAFVRRLLEGISLANTLQVLDGIAFLQDNPATGKICAETAHHFRQFLSRLKEKKARLQEDPLLKEELAREGWRGSAVAGVNIAHTERWQKTALQLDAEYQEIIARFREAILHKTPGIDI